MSYDSTVHHRRSIRLPSWDYREHGAYFVTVCIHQRECILTNQALAGIVVQTWNAIADHFSDTAVDEFVVMPNHVHGIIWIAQSTTVGARHDAPLHVAMPRRPVLER